MGISRREFLVRAGALGLSTAAVMAFLDACRKVPSGENPSPTPGDQSELSSDDLKIRHLLRRAGFGAYPDELKLYTAMGLPAVVDYLLEYSAVDDTALENRLAALAVDTTKLADIQRWWLVRMIYTRRPLLEKLVLFWHGTLTSATSKVADSRLMFNQNQLFRNHALDDYGVLLKAVSRDPAMLIWLDNRFNRKTSPNENFARELMELFTLGLGNYTETDVRESARAFTGWSQQGDSAFFNAAQHDDGPKTFLGQTGNLNGDDVVDIILQQPAAARYISRKLFEFFAYEGPDPAVVTRIADIFTASHHSLKAAVKAILTSGEFYSVRSYRAKIKSPAELVAGTLRSLGIETGGAPMLAPLRGMGQVLFNPPDVSGWKAGISWINSETLLFRINFANQVASARGPNLVFNPAEQLIKENLSSAAALDYFLLLLVDGDLSAAPRQVLKDYSAALNALPLTPGIGKSPSDEILRSLSYLVLASPEHQLA